MVGVEGASLMSVVSFLRGFVLTVSALSDELLLLEVLSVSALTSELSLISLVLF